MARLSKFAGGIGISWPLVRSRGALIRGTNGQSNGIVPWLRTLRRTALGRYTTVLRQLLDSASPH